VSFDIVPIHLAVKAMRDSGYKNAAYAIAELIDNAAQAKATRIELLCREREEHAAVRQRRRLHELAVLDNGVGMTAKTLREALQFGNGERLNDRRGIGRFGMGLPNSSLSQSRRVDVWTWQQGTQSAIHTYLDLDEIEKGRLREVPAPDQQPIPEVWRSASKGLGHSGTLVVWSNLDRCQWRTALAVIRNSEFTIGRIYRRFIAKGEVSIRMAAFVDTAAGTFTIDELAKANDPMYLMSETSCPEPWNASPMFEPYGGPTDFTVAVGGVEHTVWVRFSVAKNEARQGHNPGDKPHGRHAANNIGVSVVRADRELELQTGWNIHYDPVERWWGAEIEIPPALDEVFGVTNDKQSARALADVATVSADSMAVREGYTTNQELKEAWSNENDPRLILLLIKQHIETNLSNIRKSLEAQTRGQRQGTRRHTPNSAEARGTEATRKRQLEGYHGTSDAGERNAVEQRTREIASELTDSGMAAAEANERSIEIVNDGRKFEFLRVDLESSAFFSVRPRGGTLLIQLNTNHSAYRHLIALLEDDPDSANIEQLRSRMRKSYDGLKLLLEAWARYEDELPEAKKDQARDARADWGRVAREFLRED
jgi:hypothetical protein